MRLHGDGFDHYGTSLTNMLDGTYANAGEITLTTAQAGTGTHSLQVTGTNGLSSFAGLRKVLPSSKDKLGVQIRVYMPSLPTQPYASCIAGFMTSSPQTAQVATFFDSNGCLRFVRGRSFGGDGAGSAEGTLIAQTDPILVASAWNHIEIQIYIHDTAGWIRVAVNGIHEYQVENLDTKHNADNIVSVAQCRPYLVTGGGQFYMDDYVIYDFTGDSAVDTDWCPVVDENGIPTNYIGDLGGYLIVPNGDTAEDDWLPSTGSDAYAMVDETTPNDSDYISSYTVNDLTELSLTDLPEEITYIRGVDIIGRMSKADAGPAMIKFGMKSVADTLDAAERPVTVEPTFWTDQANIDPDSGARWTRASFNAAWLRLIRSL